MIRRELPSQQIFDDVRPMLIRPRGLDHDTAQMRIAGFGNASSRHAITGRVFAGNQAALPHPVGRVGEAREAAYFRDDAGRRRLGDTAQSLLRFDRRPDLWRRLAYCLVRGLFEFPNPRSDVICFLDVVGRRGFQRRLREADATLDPLPMSVGPRSHAVRRPFPMPQQKLPESVSRLELVLLGGFASANQIS
jgi:hypothetical protein